MRKLGISLVLLVMFLLACNTAGVAELTAEVAPDAGAELKPDVANPTLVQTVTEAATLSLTPTRIPDLPDETWVIDASSDLISPDGEWAARAITLTNNSNLTRYSYLGIEKLDGTDRYVVEDLWGQGRGIPAKLIPLFWSKDGITLYYTHYSIPDGCTVPWFIGFGLDRVSITDRQPEQVLAAFEGKAFALSPDETLLAAEGDSGFFLRDLTTNTERTFELPTELGPGPIGNIVWSPDQVGALMSWGNYCSGGEAEHAILYIDWTTGEITTLIPPTTAAYIIIEWIEPDQAVVRDKDGTYWWLDPITGDVTPRE
jgi:hypothetical protein